MQCRIFAYCGVFVIYRISRVLFAIGLLLCCRDQGSSFMVVVVKEEGGREEEEEVLEASKKRRDIFTYRIFLLFHFYH